MVRLSGEDEGEAKVNVKVGAASPNLCVFCRVSVEVETRFMLFEVVQHIHFSFQKIPKLFATSCSTKFG